MVYSNKNFLTEFEIRKYFYELKINKMHKCYAEFMIFIAESSNRVEIKKYFFWLNVYYYDYREKEIEKKKANGRI